MCIQVDNFLGMDNSDDSDSCSSLSDASNDHNACDTYEASFAARTINETDGGNPSDFCNIVPLCITIYFIF